MKTMLNNVLHPFSTPERALKILMTMVFLVPVLFGIYIFLTLAREELTFSEYLYQSSWNNLLFLNVLMNLVWTYILIKMYPGTDKETDFEYIGFILWILFISQIFVSNIFLAFLAGITLYKIRAGFRQSMSVQLFLRNKTVSIMALSLLFFSLLSGFALIRTV